MKTRKVDKDNIPEDLTERNQWVDWRYGQPRPNGKIPKIPCDAKTGKAIDAHDSSHHYSFKKVYRAYKEEGYDGIGFVFTADDPFAGIDLDDCRNPKTGKIKKWAQKIITRLNSYTEVSPSGTGVKIFVKGHLPKGRRRKGHIEFYDSGRYFTVTGNHLKGTPSRIVNRCKTLPEVYNEVFCRPSKSDRTKTSTIQLEKILNLDQPSQTIRKSKNLVSLEKRQIGGVIENETSPPNLVPLSDEEIISRAKSAKNGEKFKRLWNGNIKGYPSDSEADLALASILAFWTNRDPIQMDGLFRASKLYRPKWDKERGGKTYGQLTIEKAIETVLTTYIGRTIPIVQIVKSIKEGEQGDADLFIYLNKGRLCFDNASRSWFYWNGQYWQEDYKNNALVTVLGVRDIYIEVKKRIDGNQGFLEDVRDHFGSTTEFVNALEQRINELNKLGYRNRVLKLACAGENSLAIIGNEWDLKAGVIACPNGVIELTESGIIFRKGKPSDHIKHVISTTWKGLDEKAPLWNKTLKEIFEDDTRLIRHLQKLFGYTLFGHPTENICIFLHGKGKNGKTTIAETLKYVLGALAVTLPSATLLKASFNESGGSARADLMTLQGARIACASESEEGRRFNLAQLKLMTGSDKLTARAPFGRRMIEFDTTFVIVFLTNHMPYIPSDEYAVWQRLHLIPFNRSFVIKPLESSEQIADVTLRDKLKEEASGILAWLVRGYLGWRKHGLMKPEAVNLAIDQCRYKADIIHRFVTECCKKKDGHRVKASDLYDTFCQWSKDQKLSLWTQTRFGLEMKKRGFKATLSNGKKYKNLCLI